MDGQFAGERVTVPHILCSKTKHSVNTRKLVALTAYDFTSAKIFDAAGVDILLVGDSLGSVVQGLETTLPVTLDEMVYHCRCVSRAARRALVVGDMPFMSYQSSPEKAVESAGRLIKEGGVAAVKLEGGLPMLNTIEKMVQVDIPVMGHVGLTPQSYHRMGGHKVQGRTRAEDGLVAGSRERIIEDALAVERAGAFAVVLEGIPSDLAAEISRMLSIPTIGIGAGADCDGQVLVSADMLGMNQDFSPKFVKRYANLADVMHQAVTTYVDEVRSGAFPTAQHAFGARDDSGARSKVKLTLA
ncbi:MAG: 3-methyl-2-oxobutanoate hydroxymethyltransferase [Oligoflexia bacterium]|nr:3-methyl-2-oxobutanoate hydroxymethyltransferase [Oligoflexia bacterium]